MPRKKAEAAGEEKVQTIGIPIAPIEVLIGLDDESKALLNAVLQEVQELRAALEEKSKPAPVDAPADAPPDPPAPKTEDIEGDAN